VEEFHGNFSELEDLLSKDIFRSYQSFIKNNEEKCLNDLVKITTKLNNSNAKYKGEIIDFLYQPMFFHQGDFSRFEYITKMMISIIEKCTEEYLKNPVFRELFGYSKIMEELILIDPGYKNPVPIARFDLFYNDDYKFCELNGDGTSAMNETNTLEQIFTESEIIKELRKDYKISYHELFLSWLKQLLNIYKEFGGTEKPNIAISDFMGLGSNEEFDTFKEVFEKQGYKTVICDPRDMKYQDGKLCVDDIRIDLIYRRAVNKEVELRIDEVSDFLQAYKEKAVCVVGPFRSQIMHNKIFFEILSSEDKTKFLNTDERDFIIKHIPKTYTLDKKTLPTAIENKDKYLIKPKDYYAGKGVVCGLDRNDGNWENELNDAIEKGGFLLQEFCNFTKKMLPEVIADKFEFSEYKTTLGLFVYNSKLSGLYSRVGRKNVIAGIEESITLPSFVYKKKEVE
jgi:hypothetical protein